MGGEGAEQELLDGINKPRTGIGKRKLQEDTSNRRGARGLSVDAAIAYSCEAKCVQHGEKTVVQSVEIGVSELVAASEVN